MNNTPSPCFRVAPSERHEFVVSHSNDFLYSVCKRPRALHLIDGFEPSNSRSIYSHVAQFVRYRGPHPYFTRPGATKKKNYDQKGGYER